MRLLQNLQKGESYDTFDLKISTFVVHKLYDGNSIQWKESETK